MPACLLRCVRYTWHTHRRRQTTPLCVQYLGLAFELQCNEEQDNPTRNPSCLPHCPRVGRTCRSLMGSSLGVGCAEGKSQAHSLCVLCAVEVQNARTYAWVVRSSHGLQTSPQRPRGPWAQWPRIATGRFLDPAGPNLTRARPQSIGSTLFGYSGGSSRAPADAFAQVTIRPAA
jgi:hypothetical protein